MDKELIRYRFKKSLLTYQRQAVVQKEICNKLLRMLEISKDCRLNRILEVGSGSGILSGELVNMMPEAFFYFNDFVEETEDLLHEKLKDSAPEYSFLHGDIESIDLPYNLDLVISGSTFQWLKDLPRIFAKLAANMHEGGILVFNSFGPDNCEEIKAITGVGLDYRSLKQVKDMLSAHFEIDIAYEERMPLLFADPIGVLQHLRQTGVNGISRSGWTKQQFNHFIKEYCQRFEVNNHVTLTYHPIFIKARKRK